MTDMARLLRMSCRAVSGEVPEDMGFLLILVGEDKETGDRIHQWGGRMRMTEITRVLEKALRMARDSLIEPEIFDVDDPIVEDDEG